MRTAAVFEEQFQLQELCILFDYLSPGWRANMVVLETYALSKNVPRKSWKC